MKNLLKSEKKRKCGHLKPSTAWLKTTHHDVPRAFYREGRPLLKSYSQHPDEFVRTKKLALQIVRIDRRNAELKKIFNALVDKWKRETRHISSISRTSMHHAYQNIIGLGEPAVPLILRELEEHGGHWLWALHAITREDPAQDGDDFDTAVQAWLNWGRSHGYL